MGLAASANKFWVGTATEVWGFHSALEVAQSIEPVGKHDACYLPRRVLAIKDQRPAYVTALGATNAARGWRENKRNRGIAMSVPNGEIVAHGLAMPHSPRWHEGNLWLRESGTGSLGIVDLARGKFEPLVQLPGFTRGMRTRGSTVHRTRQQVIGGVNAACKSMGRSGRGGPMGSPIVGNGF